MITQQMQMPDRIQVEESYSDSHCRFVIQPLEHGYANTIGNAMRRVLLSSIPGAAIVGVKISNVLHEFQSIPHVVEDVSEIILNLKEVKIKLSDKKIQRVLFHVKGPGTLTAKYIQATSPNLEVMDIEQHIATLSKGADFDVELRIGRGKGFIPAEEQVISDFPIGMLPIDSVYTPVLLVNMSIEPFRVGQRTDYERLLLDVKTDGTVTAKEAVHYASKILIEHFRLFTSFETTIADDIVPTVVLVEDEQKIAEKNRVRSILLTSVDELELSVRAHNCLKVANIKNIAELVQLQESELLKFRNFGKKSLEELSDLVQLHGLAFGMNTEQYLKEDIKPPIINF